jgi:hypothetical protein
LPSSAPPSSNAGHPHHLRRRGDGDPDGGTFCDCLLTVARAGDRNVKAPGLAQQRLETVSGFTFNQ